MESNTYAGIALLHPRYRLAILHRHLLDSRATRRFLKESFLRMVFTAPLFFMPFRIFAPFGAGDGTHAPVGKFGGKDPTFGTENHFNLQLDLLLVFGGYRQSGRFAWGLRFGLVTP